MPMHLTARQLEVLDLMAQAYTNDQIAAALVIERRTVEALIMRIYDRLNLVDCNPRVAAASLYWKGEIEFHDNRHKGNNSTRIIREANPYQ